MTPIVPSRETSLGLFHLLPDELTIESILDRLSPKDLCAVSKVSRYLFVFARNDRIWRRRFFSTRDPNSTRLVFRGTWLLTYIYPRPEDKSALASHPLSSDPVQIHGVVSDYLHRQWIKSNMFFGHFFPPPALPPVCTSTDSSSMDQPRLHIPIEDYQQLDRETFYRRYGYPNKPVMLRNSGVESWSAWEQWTLDALLAKHGDTLFRVSNIDSNTEPTFLLSFQDFVHYVRNNRDLDPLYLFDPNFVDAVPEMETAYEVPKFFDFDFFSLLEPKDRPPYRWMLIGPQRTGAPWHTDPSGTSAWNTLLSGHKRWALYPPHITPPGYDPSSPKRLSSVSWFLDVYPFLPPEARPLEIVQYPGQTIFVPSGWWHMVLNMDDTVAVTQNFADETNILQVRRSMTEDLNEPTQIRRWGLLRERLSVSRPDLAPAIGDYPEEEALESLMTEASWLDPLEPESIDSWEERVRDVMDRSVGSPYLGPVTPIHTGQNVCFLTDQGFVKFFTPMHDGLLSYGAEVKSNELLLTVLEQPHGGRQVLISPKMLGYGYFLEVSPDDPGLWRWPYIVTESARSVENDLVDAAEFIPQDESGYKDVLSPIMETLDFYHSLPLPSSIDGAQSFHQISRRLQNAVSNHLRWRVFPKQLLETLPNYLPSDPRAVFNPSEGSRVASLVHGDVSPSNILGTFSPFDASIFTPKMLIDFGDASFKMDPLLDYVSVFITVLNCRKDKSLTDMLKDSWTKSTFSKGLILEPNRDLVRQSLWHVLMWPSVGLSAHLVRCVPNLGVMERWEEVEQAVFGWWN